ncbi:MAG TPA: pilus assembly protein TadG-related protein [Acidimicrobiales bacterium]|nr:pilus assembly protein TadG-related protein [Acidimicrobiales bacterium]
MRRLTPVGRRDEQGAVVVLMAVFAVVIVVMAALVIDVGSMLDEKRQLQNGADAGALGAAQLIGQTCPKSACPASTLVATAQGLANGNAHDNATKIDAVTADYSTSRVTVRTSTKAAGGATILPYWFAQALGGEPGKTLHAKATASWGGIGQAKVTPLILSLCEFNAATLKNTRFGVPTVIQFHKDASTCASGPSGADLPGGYGWVRDNHDSAPNDCSVTPAVGVILNDDTGLPGTPHSCNLTTLLNKDVLVPIYNVLTGSGSNGLYTIYGFGEFHLTGFFFSNSDKGADNSGLFPCKKPQTCIGGYFIKFVAVGQLGGPNVGNYVNLVS